MKRFIPFITLLLFVCFSLPAQNTGKLLFSDYYHEIDRFEFYGTVSVTQRDFRIEIYENEIIFYYVDSGNKSIRAKVAFVKINSDGDRVYIQDLGRLNEPYYFYVKKDGSLSANKRFSYTKGVKPSSQSSSSGSNQNYNINNGNSYNNNSNQPSYVVCPACNGTGRDQGRIQYNTNGGNRYCPTCGKTGLAHEHIYARCGRCDGTGRVKQY